MRVQKDDKPPFGTTRKDVLLIGAGLTGVGCGMYYGLQVGAPTLVPSFI